MGQKVNPRGFRIPLTKDWNSKWFAEKKDFGDLLHEDLRIKDYIKKKLQQAAISRINIERFANRVRITVHSARPGLVIGRKGSEIDSLKTEISALTKGKEIYIDIKEVKRPELDAQLVAENIAEQLLRRVSFRRAMKKTLQMTMDMGAEGIRIRCAGRLGGAELARVEQYRAGSVPLHTLRKNVEYGFAEANTLAGKIGIKVWICRDKEMEDSKNVNAKTRKASQGAKRKSRRKSK
ncbi:MAG: 30S ribosomal protein S3 [Verrucomicrobiota bacterium]|nr:30S ribosomal protein S3 [Verrucomicrobiota bacterium]